MHNPIHMIARLAVGFVWIYHGVVPKLIYQHADELALLREAGAAPETAATIVTAIGWAEIAAGVWVLLGFPSSRWPFLTTIAFGIVTTIGVAIQSPQYLVAAFNPVSLNAMMIAMSVVGLRSQSVINDDKRQDGSQIAG